MRVWLIDDDHVTNMLNQYFMDEHFPECRVTAYSDAEEALDILCKQSETPDCIFLDINMPVMNGWEFIEELKASNLNTNIPDIYILSSSVDPADLERASSSSFIKGFISKPLELEKVSFLEKKFS